jgi:hypothetical protein
MPAMEPEVPHWDDLTPEQQHVLNWVEDGWQLFEILRFWQEVPGRPPGGSDAADLASAARSLVETGLIIEWEPSGPWDESVRRPVDVAAEYVGDPANWQPRQAGSSDLAPREPQHSVSRAAEHIFKDQLISVDLTPEEREVLVTAIDAWKWGPPTYCTEEFAVAMGFASVRDLKAESVRLHGLLDWHQPLVPLDWAKVLVATEVAFASNMVGVGLDWTAVTPFTDEQTIRLLRELQSKLRGPAFKVRTGALARRGRPDQDNPEPTDDDD